MTTYQPGGYHYAGAKTISPGFMQPGDVVARVDDAGLNPQSFTVEQVQAILIPYHRQMVEVWWIKGYGQGKTIKTVCVPRQHWYLIKRIEGR